MVCYWIMLIWFGVIRQSMKILITWVICCWLRKILQNLKLCMVVRVSYIPSLMFIVLLMPSLIVCMVVRELHVSLCRLSLRKLSCANSVFQTEFARSCANSVWQTECTTQLRKLSLVCQTELRKLSLPDWIAQ